MFLGLGLKLLGIGEIIKEFFLRNWKWLIPLIALIASFFIVSNIYYDKGVMDERVQWEEKVKKESESNRKFEKLIYDAIATFGADAVNKAIERTSKETVYKEKIQTIIKDNPIYSSCIVDQEVIDSRNAIRALGPKEEYPVTVDIGASE